MHVRSSNQLAVYTHLDVEAALPLKRERRGVEIQLDPVIVLALAVPLALLAGSSRCHDVGVDEREARGPPVGLRQERRLQGHHVFDLLHSHAWAGGEGEDS